MIKTALKFDFCYPIEAILLDVRNRDERFNVAGSRENVERTNTLENSDSLRISAWKKPMTFVQSKADTVKSSLPSAVTISERLRKAQEKVKREFVVVPIDRKAIEEKINKEEAKEDDMSEMLKRVLKIN